MEKEKCQYCKEEIVEVDETTPGFCGYDCHNDWYDNVLM